MSRYFSVRIVAGERSFLTRFLRLRTLCLISNLVKTFLELGDATSRNLKFSHRPDVYVSYGEETITETNLLEIRRRHSDRVHLETFSKKKESQSGADWEWHIIGNSLTLKMRVQAKRTRWDKDRLIIKYNDQRQQLLEMSKCKNMKPIYCIYCTEPQRSIWMQAQESDDFEGFQAGCLLADANDVPETTKNLYEIEDKCIPWHHLFKREEFVRRKSDGLISAHVTRAVGLDDTDRDPITTRWKAPTIEDLHHGQGDSDFDHTGVYETNVDEISRSIDSPVRHTRISNRGTHRIMRIDVRDQ